MAYERCLACGSSGVTPPAKIETSRGRLSAKFDLKDPPEGFLAKTWLDLEVDRVCVCSDCGFAAFFTSQKFDLATIVRK